MIRAILRRLRAKRATHDALDAIGIPYRGEIA